MVSTKYSSLAGDAAGDVARVRPELRDDLGEGERVQPDDQRAHPLDRLSHAHVPLLQVILDTITCSC